MVGIGRGFLRREAEAISLCVSYLAGRSFSHGHAIAGYNGIFYLSNSPGDGSLDSARFPLLLVQTGRKASG